VWMNFSGGPTAGTRGSPASRREMVESSFCDNGAAGISAAKKEDVHYSGFSHGLE